MTTVIDGITGVNRITGGADVGGNLDFVANGSRITGPSFSSSPASTRFAFQTSNSNSVTIVAAIPNGTGGASFFRAMNNPDMGNSNYLDLRCTASLATIEANYEGTATPLPLSFYTGGTERMRIDAGGNVIFGKTIADFQVSGLHFEGGNKVLVGTNANSRAFLAVRTGSDGECVSFFKATSQVGNIAVSPTTTTYNTTSDYRLKENIRAMVAPLERLLRLKPVLFNWKVDSSDGEGFIAHELQKEVPMAVTGEKDGEQMQAVDLAKVVPLLVAAVQELTLKVLALEARLS